MTNQEIKAMFDLAENPRTGQGAMCIHTATKRIDELEAEVTRLRELCGKAAGVCRIYNYGPLCAALEAAAKGEK